MEQFVQHATFIGAGQMGSAMVRAIVRAGVMDAARITVSDPHRDKLAALVKDLGVSAMESNAAAVAKADLVVLAVKPQVFAAVVDELKGRLSRDCTVVTIAAGITTDAVGSGLGGNVRVVRLMPNTPCLVQAGAIGLSLGRHATLKDEKRVRSLLSSLGELVTVPENLMDAVTGLSGSGPAFIYLMIEALADAGVRAGLTREASRLLAAQTVYGSAKMVLETGIHPAELKEMVTSPGGTTIAGLHLLEQRGVRGTIMDAVMAAVERSTELGRTSMGRSVPALAKEGDN